MKNLPLLSSSIKRLFFIVFIKEEQNSNQFKCNETLTKTILDQRYSLILNNLRSLFFSIHLLTLRYEFSLQKRENRDCVILEI